MCGQFMDEYPCGSVIGFTPPGGDETGNFYEPDDFPENGTATTSNIAGEITSPVSGTIYTWTYNDLERTVTVVSADAQATPTGGSNGEESNGEEQSEDKGKDTENKDKPDAASGTMPSLTTLVALMILSVTMIL